MFETVLRIKKILSKNYFFLDGLQILPLIFPLKPNIYLQITSKTG